MISGTRFYANEDLFVSQEDAARAAAFIEADIKHKENPPSVVDLLPFPLLKDFTPEKPELYNISADRCEKNNHARQHPDRVHKMLRDL